MLRVWLDAAEIRLGDSIRSKIDEGLSSSRFGIVVLSLKFWSMNWPARELNALFAIEQEGQHAILPVWHNCSHPRRPGQFAQRCHRTTATPQLN